MNPAGRRRSPARPLQFADLMKRIWIGLTLALCLSAQDKPNIVFILADDMSFRDLSAWGQQRFRTPTLDRLAAEGMRFTNAYAAAPECAPSRGTLLTGMHTGHASVRANASARTPQDHLRDEDVTVAEMLKAAGYATAFVGKWGVGLPGSPGVPEKQGFDYSFGFLDQRQAHTYFPHYLWENGVKARYPRNYGFDLRRLYRNNALRPELADLNRYDADGKFVPVGVRDPRDIVYSEDVIEQAALRFVRERRDEPFFLYFATQLPHGPTVIDELGPLKDRQDFPSVKHKEWAAMVMRLDTFTAELLALLEELGVAENTAVFFASDNGYAMCGYFGRGNAGENWPDDPFFRNKGPFRGGKFSALEGGVRVPFFAHWPKRFRSGVSSAPVWLLDLFPTFAELAGTRVEHDVDGDSLGPLMWGDKDEFPAESTSVLGKNRNEQAVSDWGLGRAIASIPTTRSSCI